MADALASGASARKGVEVQLLSRARWLFSSSSRFLQENSRSPGPGVLLLGGRCRASGCPTDPVKRGEPALGRPATAKSPRPDLFPGRGWQGEGLRGDRLQRGWPSVGCARGGTRPSCGRLMVRVRRGGVVGVGQVGVSRACPPLEEVCRHADDQARTTRSSRPSARQPRRPSASSVPTQPSKGNDGPTSSPMRAM